jgi:hypothetical protein
VSATLNLSNQQVAIVTRRGQPTTVTLTARNTDGDPLDLTDSEIVAKVTTVNGTDVATFDTVAAGNEVGLSLSAAALDAALDPIDRANGEFVGRWYVTVKLPVLGAEPIPWVDGSFTVLAHGSRQATTSNVITVNVGGTVDVTLGAPGPAGRPGAEDLIRVDDSILEWWIDPLAVFLPTPYPRTVAGGISSTGKVTVLEWAHGLPYPRRVEIADAVVDDHNVCAVWAEPGRRMVVAWSNHYADRSVHIKVSDQAGTIESLVDAPDQVGAHATFSTVTLKSYAKLFKIPHLSDDSKDVLWLIVRGRTGSTPAEYDNGWHLHVIEVDQATGAVTCTQDLTWLFRVGAPLPYISVAEDMVAVDHLVLRAAFSFNPSSDAGRKWLSYYEIDTTTGEITSPQLPNEQSTTYVDDAGQEWTVEDIEGIVTNDGVHTSASTHVEASYRSEMDTPGGFIWRGFFKLPATLSADTDLARRYESSGNGSWFIRVTTAGRIAFRIRSNGGTEWDGSLTSVTPPGMLGAADWYGIEFKFDPTGGPDGEPRVSGAYSTDLGQTWETLGSSTYSDGALAMDTSTAPLKLGWGNDAANRTDIDWLAVQLTELDGTPIADATFTDWPVRPNVYTGLRLPIRPQPGDALVESLPDDQRRRLFYVRPGPSEPALAYADWTIGDEDNATYKVIRRVLGTTTDPHVGGYTTPTGHIEAVYRDEQNTPNGFKVTAFFRLDGPVSVDTDLFRRYDSGPNGSWFFRVRPDGRFAFRVRRGDTQTEWNSTLPGFPSDIFAGGWVGLEATFNPTGGPDGVARMQGYYSLDLGQTWTYLNGGNFPSAIVLNPSTSAVKLGYGSAEANRARIHWRSFKLEDLSGNVIVDVDFINGWPNRATSHVDNAGQEWVTVGEALVGDGWVVDEFGASGPRIGHSAAANYLPGMAFPGYPCSDDRVVLIRRADGVSTVEEWRMRPDGTWRVNMLTSSPAVLARPYLPRGGGPVRAIYSVVHRYGQGVNEFTDYLADTRIV